MIIELLPGKMKRSWNMKLAKLLETLVRAKSSLPHLKMSESGFSWELDWIPKAHSAIESRL